MRLLLAVLLPLTMVACAAAEDGAMALPESALPAGAAESVLPQGAILHLRLGGLAQVLESLDRLVVPFVPSKALSAEQREFLAQPQPLLAFLGAQSVGQPLTPALVSQISGIASDRPLTLTFYPASPQQGFVLALPIADRAALAGLLMNTTAAVMAEPIDLGGKPGLDIIGGNSDLPERFVAVTSPDMLYLCGSPELARQIVAAAGGQALATSPAVAKALADHAKADLAIVIDAGMLKGLLPMAQQNFATIPPGSIAEARAALAKIDRPTRAQIDLRLHMQFGIGLDALVDYSECLAVGTYEVLFAALMRELAGLDGIALAIDLGERDQRATLALYSAGVVPANWPKAIPRAAVKAGLALLPGDRDLIAIAGQDPAATPSAFTAAWVATVNAKLAAKRLPPTFGALLTRFAAGQMSAPTLAARVPWMIDTQVTTAPAPRPAAAASLGEWATAIGRWLSSGGTSSVTLLPTTDGALLEKHLREVAAAADANAAAWNALSEPLFGAPFADTAHRVRAEPAKDGVGTIISEDAWITRSGIFGYTQHELINRSITRWRTFAGHLLVQRSASDTRWLTTVAAQPRPLTPALAGLLALPPADASAIAAGRQLHLVIDLVDLLVDLETLARRELDAYLAQAKALDAKHAADPEALAEALAGIDMPLLMVALERGRDGQLSIRLLADLRYPRPAAMPLVRGLFADYAAKADRLGGGVAWQRVSPGRIEWALVQRSDALAALVQTVGDALYGTYLNDRQGQQTLQRTLNVRGDGRPMGPSLVTNPLWAAFK